MTTDGVRLDTGARQSPRLVGDYLGFAVERDNALGNQDFAEYPFKSLAWKGLVARVIPDDLFNKFGRSRVRAYSGQ